MERINNQYGYDCCVESLIGGRQENQDDFGFCDTALGLLVVVCDGMGGGPGGKTASSMATAAIKRSLMAAPRDILPQDALAQAVDAANMDVINAQRADRSLLGMGTTCVAILLNGGKAYIIHVGDSRCYQLRNGKIQFRTNDHSFVGELVRNKTLTEEQARTAGNSNIITKAVGVKPRLEPEIDIVNYKPGDRFALMSDGIWGAMPQEKLVDMLSANGSALDVVEDTSLAVDAIGRNNGNRHDNLTLAIIDIPGKKSYAAPVGNSVKASAATAKQQTMVTDHSRKPNNKGIYLAVIVLLIAVIAALLSFIFFKNDDAKTVADDKTTELLAETNVQEVPINETPDADEPDAQSAINSEDVSDIASGILGGNGDVKPPTTSIAKTEEKPATETATHPKNVATSAAQSQLATQTAKAEKPTAATQAPKNIENAALKEKISDISSRINKIEAQEYSANNKNSVPSNDDIANCEKQRKSMLDGVIKEINSCKNIVNAPVPELNDLEKYIKSNRGKLIKVDRRHGKTTQDGKEAYGKIRDHMKQIEKKI